MDEIEFVVAERALGNGPQICAEPLINGESLIEIVARVEGKPPGYAGLPPDVLLAQLDPASARDQAQVLGCTCGDDLCSWPRVTVTAEPERIIWCDIRASHGDTQASAGLSLFWALPRSGSACEMSASFLRGAKRLEVRACFREADVVRPTGYVWTLAGAGRVRAIVLLPADSADLVLAGVE